MNDIATLRPTVSGLIWEGDRAPIAKALVAAQKATESVKKAASNPAFKSKYADLSAVVEGVIPALNNAGVGVIQAPAFDGEWVSVETTFLHESGSAVSSTLCLRPSKTDPQGVGSALTYGRRYALLAMTGAAPEDDDGNAASGPRTYSETQRAAPGPTAADLAINLLRGCDADAGLFKEAWAKNFEGWKKVMAADDYARVQTVKAEISAKFVREIAEAKAREEAAKPKGGADPGPFDELNGDTIPFIRAWGLR